MKLTVVFHGQLRTAAGAPAAEIEVPEGATAQDLLGVLAARYGALKPLLLPAGSEAGGQACGRRRSALLVAVGDRQVRLDEPLNVPAGETVMLLPPIGGG